MSALWQQTEFLWESLEMKTQRRSPISFYSVGYKKKGRREDRVSSDLVSFLQWTVWPRASSGGRYKKKKKSVSSIQTYCIIAFSLKMYWSCPLKCERKIKKKCFHDTFVIWFSINTSQNPPHEGIISIIHGRFIVEVFALPVFNCNT